MRIISLNAWGGAMYESLAEWLPNCGADVLCLQEVTCTAGLGGWTQFDDGERTLPQRANLYADVRSLLPRHQAIFLTSDSGPVVDAHGYRHQQDFGIAMFVHEQNPIVGSESAFVHGSYTDLNLLPDSNTFRVLADIGLMDLVGTADTRTSKYTNPIRHANYMLVSDPDKIVRFVAPSKPEISDHRFLVLEI